MTTTIKGKAGALITGISRLALPYGNSTLFTPLRLKVKDGKVQCAVQSQSKTSFVLAETTLGTIEGEGDVTFDPQQLLKFLGLYGNEEEVTITIGDTIKLSGARRTATIYPEVLTPLVMTNIPKVIEGIVHYKDGPATTQIEVEVDQLKDLIGDARLVEMANFPLTFSASGSKASLGSGEAKHNTIETQIHAKVTGPDANVVLGEDFAFLVDNLEGIVECQLSEAHPLVFLTKGDWGRAMYITAPKRTETAGE